VWHEVDVIGVDHLLVRQRVHSDGRQLTKGVTQREHGRGERLARPKTGSAVVDHIAIVVRFVGSQQADGRGDDAALPLALPVGAKAVADTLHR
ncbi:hypothetical protein G9P59_29230, partial [Klebsiella pneumoniae]|nr:hypothetical protein [Klebsiella pneumoniae]